MPKILKIVFFNRVIILKCCAVFFSYFFQLRLIIMLFVFFDLHTAQPCCLLAVVIHYCLFLVFIFKGFTYFFTLFRKNRYSRLPASETNLYVIFVAHEPPLTLLLQRTIRLVYSCIVPHRHRRLFFFHPTCHHLHSPYNHDTFLLLFLLFALLLGL